MYGSNSQSHLLFKLKEKLVNLGLAETDIENVIDTLKRDDLFRKCNTQTLKHLLITTLILYSLWLPMLCQ